MRLISFVRVGFNVKGCGSSQKFINNLCCYISHVCGLEWFHCCHVLLVNGLLGLYHRGVSNVFRYGVLLR